MSTVKGKKEETVSMDEKSKVVVEQPKEKKGGRPKDIVELLELIKPDSEVYLLPTKGLLYPFDRVRIRKLTSKEEKKFAGITPKNFNLQINKVLESCVLEPQGFNAEDLTLGDRQTLLTWLRISTYGPEYYADIICPNCRVQNSNVQYDLNNLNDLWLPDDFKEPYFVEFDSFKGGVELRLMRVRDDIDNDQYLAQQRKFRPVNREDEWIVRYARTISSVIVDGQAMEGMTFKDIVLFFDSLPGDDTVKIRDWHNKHDHGVDLRVPFTCGNCGYETDQIFLDINASFFLPTQVKDI